MKANTHPNYNPAAVVVCSCGNSFTVGSTQDTIHIELCNKCHPFYTGQQKFVDTASRIEKFQKKMQAVKPNSKKKKEERKSDDRPMTLREMLQSVKR
jgi:large subunit ribosomal protein L31